VPKKYLREVGEDGFKKHPIGAGPYKFVSTKPGIEVVLEAFPQYWRRAPNVKTLVMRSVPEATIRAADAETGEADIAYALDGPDAEGLQKEPGIQIVASKHASIFWIEFAKQWDEKSPWHDQAAAARGELCA
jgi:peptide/nickel transport system substrate-binding protein